MTASSPSHPPDTRAPAPPLRIAFIGGRGVGSAYSGIERYYEEIGSRLAARGHRVLIYCRSYFSPKGRTYRGMEIRRLPTLRSKHLETFLHSFLATLDVCLRPIDVVQFHALGSSPFAWVPRLFGKRTVVSVRGLDWQRAKWGLVARAYLQIAERTAVYCPNRTVVVSRVLRDHFQRRFGREIVFIPNGVGEVHPPAGDWISKWNLEPRRYLLYAGRLSPEKGLETLIEAHRGLAQSCRLVIAGGSSYSEEYIARLRALAGPEVVFTGFQTGPTLEALFGNALTFVLPSHMEGLSVALLEAMSYGLPVVASDIPENRELVAECGGFLFELGNARDLGRVLRDLIDHPEEAVGAGREIRQKVRARFDWDRIAAQTERFFQDLVAEPLREAGG
jgi:glycosyltransferase involved in cell wall biosynthesis